MILKHFCYMYSIFLGNQQGPSLRAVLWISVTAQLAVHIKIQGRLMNEFSCSLAIPRHRIMRNIIFLGIAASFNAGN